QLQPRRHLRPQGKAAHELQRTQPLLESPRRLPLLIPRNPLFPQAHLLIPATPTKALHPKSLPTTLGVPHDNNTSSRSAVETELAVTYEAALATD
ncbi:hypothetical protein, partial [uncultured Duncaniella sp.]|uniref:hypothetical protein n=1 Tax=uncultured Duncaniella sp. TaxID=2768039 RepID=UPI00265E2551